MFRAIPNTGSQVLLDLSSISPSLSECYRDFFGPEDDTRIPLCALREIERNNMDVANFESLLETFPIQMARKMEIGKSSQTLLHAAAEQGNLAAMTAILKGRFIDINVLGVLHSHQNDETLTRMTPLMFAVYCNQLEAAALLLEYGADVDTKNSKGETALMILQRTNVNSIVLSLLEDHALQNCSDTDPLIKHSAFPAVESKYSESLMSMRC